MWVNRDKKESESRLSFEAKPSSWQKIFVTTAKPFWCISRPAQGMYLFIGAFVTSIFLRQLGLNQRHDETTYHMFFICAKFAFRIKF